MSLQVSLVIPVRNESASLGELLASIERQSFRPAEVIIVDGGSTDDTLVKARSFAQSRPWLKIIEAGEATPGRGRNVGIEAANNEWVALTDAGITLNDDWLEHLVGSAIASGADVVFGDVDPITQNRFEMCATLSYVSPRSPGGIRCKFIASSLIRKEIWVEVGGFPDFRAAEDLEFMDAIDRRGFITTVSPNAIVHWRLRPDLFSTFQKFVLYSKHNVWLGREWDWHYGILRQYLLLVPFVVLAFVHSFWWLITIPVWLCLRVAKRIVAHRTQFELRTLLNPFTIVGVMLITVTIDLATYVGWIQATFTKLPPK